MRQTRMRLWVVVFALGLGCSSSHRGDAATDADATRDGGGRSDSGAQDSGGVVDGGAPPVLEAQVLDRLGMPASGGRWRLEETGGGAVIEGEFGADGMVQVGLQSHTSYDFTVAAPGLGARSLVGFRGTTRARIQLDVDTRPDPARGSFDVRVSGAGTGEFVLIGGPGVERLRLLNGASGVSAITYVPGLDAYGLIGIVGEPQTIRIDGMERPMSQPTSARPLRAVRLPPLSSPPSSEVALDVSTGTAATVRLAIEISVPSEGAYQPRPLYAEAIARRDEGFWPSGIDIPVGTTALQPNDDRTILGGELTYFAQPELQPDYLELWLLNGAGDLAARIRATPDMGRVEIPASAGPAEIEGGRVSELTFSASSPMWSNGRFGFEQRNGDALVQWVVVSSTGQFVRRSMPSLPSGLDYAALGFATGDEVTSFLSVYHRFRWEEDPVLAIPSKPPYVSGTGVADGRARLEERMRF